MFKIGDQVKWQSRNANSTFRARDSFHSYTGTVDSVSDSEIVVAYTWTRNGIDTYTSMMQFRKLPNHNWIPKNEKKNDPKGRLNLCLAVEE